MTRPADDSWHRLPRFDPDDAPFRQDQSELPRGDARARANIDSHLGYRAAVEPRSQSSPQGFGIPRPSPAVGARELGERLRPISHACSR